MSLKLLKLSSKIRRSADRRVSFDLFVEYLILSQDRSSLSMEKARDIKALLKRSGYPELAERMEEVIGGIKEMSDLIDTLRKMHSQGKLRFGPRA